MKYEKPELVVLSHAVKAVRGSQKPDDFVTDNEPDKLTIGAYEADE